MVCAAIFHAQHMSDNGGYGDGSRGNLPGLVW